jgi:hypothetical protein
MNYTKPFFAIAIGGVSSFIGYGLVFGNEKLYSSYVMPSILKLMDGEEAHSFAINLAKYKLVPFSSKYENEEILVILFSFFLKFIPFI